jgi:hypothetical protein
VEANFMTATACVAISDRDLDLSMFDEGVEQPIRSQQPPAAGMIALDRFRPQPTAQIASTYFDEPSPIIAIDHERLRVRLMRLLQRFSADGLTTSPFSESTVITKASKRAAETFLSLLPSDYRLPKVGPDGEGGVVLAWEQNNRTVLLTLQGWTLHLVDAPARSAADYLDNLSFGGDVLPQDLMGFIPRR